MDAPSTPPDQQTPRQIDEQLAELWEQISRVAADIHHYDYERQRGLLRGSQLERLRLLLERRDALVEFTKPLEEEFRRRGGWTRYFLVVGGHVHRERCCSTCRPRTQYGWLPHLSDCDVSAMVKEYGDGACAVCFPEVLDHPDYLRAAEARRLADELKVLSACAMSGQAVPSGAAWTANHRRIRCPGCRKIVPVTRTYLIRRHSPKIQESAQEQAPSAPKE